MSEITESHQPVLGDTYHSLVSICTRVLGVEAIIDDVADHCSSVATFLKDTLVIKVSWRKTPIEKVCISYFYVIQGRIEELQGGFDVDVRFDTGGTLMSKIRSVEPYIHTLLKDIEP